MEARLKEKEKQHSLEEARVWYREGREGGGKEGGGREERAGGGVKRDSCDVVCMMQLLREIRELEQQLKKWQLAQEEMRESHLKEMTVRTS